jgi:hypothetical protein
MNLFKKTVITSLIIFLYFYQCNKILAESNEYTELLEKIDEIESNFNTIFIDLIEAEKLGVDVSSNIEDLNIILNNIKITKDLLDDEKIDEVKSFIIYNEEIIQKISKELETQIDTGNIKRQQMIQINTIISILIIVIGIYVWKIILKNYNDSILKLKPEVENTEY